jgi:hypothetical protein
LKRPGWLRCPASLKPNLAAAASLESGAEAARGWRWSANRDGSKAASYGWRSCFRTLAESPTTPRSPDWWGSPTDDAHWRGGQSWLMVSYAWTS